MSDSVFVPLVLEPESLLDFASSPTAVQTALESMGRTEDVRCAPDGSYIAVLGFAHERILLFQIAWGKAGDQTGLTLTAHLDVRSDNFAYPHGLDFADMRTVLVANRRGKGEVFHLPDPLPWGETVVLSSKATIERVGFRKPVRSPGSVAVQEVNGDRIGLLLCNNYAHRVTRHVLRRSSAGGETGFEVIENAVALEKGLKIPDGVSHCKATGAVAISNHVTHEVFLYPDAATLTKTTEPSCVLERIDYPHGLRFTKDGRYLLVADAGQPYVLVFARGAGWAGRRAPVAHVRVMNDHDYLKGRYNPQEGGPKGLDLDPENRVMFVTSQFNPLAAFDLAEILCRIEARLPA